MRRIPIVRLGLHAQRFVAEVRAAEVVAVFERSAHLASNDGRYLCIAAPGLANGPLNAVCGDLGREPFAALGLRAGAHASVDQGGIGIAGGPGFDLAAAEVWQPEPWPPMPGPGQLRRALGDLERAARGRVPFDGVSRAAFGLAPAGGLAGAVQRTAQLPLATLADWLAAREAGTCGLDEAGEGAVRRLLGLGPGLTPSGDDVVAGLLIALHATGRNATAAALAGYVRRAPADATSALSRALLEAAIDGAPGETMHEVVSALLQGETTELVPLLDRLDAIGHTSGWDMLAGAYLGLSAAADAG